MRSREDGAAEVVVLDVGRRKKRALKRLRRGEGKLMARVYEAIEAAYPEAAGDDADVLPVVILYRKRERKRERKQKRGLLAQLIE